MSDVDNTLLVKFCCLQIKCLHVSLDMIDDSSSVLLQIIIPLVHYCPLRPISGATLSEIAS